MNIQVGREAELVESKKKLVSGTYLHNAWYVAAWSDDITEGQLLGRTILKEPVVIYRMPDGKVAALADRCVHRFAPLSMGKIVSGNRVQCPYHGLEYDTSGACVLNPHGNKHIPPRARVEELSGDREAQGDLDLDGRQGAGRVQGSRLQRAGQCAGASLDQARPHHDQGQCRADHRQPARPQPHLLSARRHSRQFRNRGIRYRRAARWRRCRGVALRPQRQTAGNERADVAGRTGEGRQVHPDALDGALDACA